MNRSLLLWILALALTLGSAVYQRITGPTQTLRGEVEITGSPVDYRLERTHGGAGDQAVTVTVPDSAVKGWVVWRRYPTDDPWTESEMARDGDRLRAFLPQQPPSGKLAYRVKLSRAGQTILIPSDDPVITRFKGAVPGAVLWPHIIFMFAGMLISNRVGMESLRKDGKIRGMTVATTLLLLAGGLILGPVIQYFAFGEFWTGFPFGTDLTDNKTLIAFLAWIAALFAGRGGRSARWWVFSAALITLVIFLIPHSLLGSELQYE